jgi:hypothetical protein
MLKRAVPLTAIRLDATIDYALGAGVWMRKRALVLVAAVVAPLIMTVGGLAYLLWWENTHCIFCGKKLGPGGKCTNPDCSLGRLTD